MNPSELSTCAKPAANHPTDHATPPPGVSTPKPDSIRRLGIRSTIALASLALLSAGGFYTQILSLQMAAPDPYLISLSGQQRSLFIKASWSLEKLATTHDSQQRLEIRQELDQLISAFEHNNQIILKYRPAQAVRHDRASKQQAAEALSPIDRGFKDYTARVRSLLAMPDEQLTPQSSEIRLLLNTSFTNQMLAGIDAVISAFQAQTTHEVKRLHRISALLLVAILASLMLVGLGILKPMILRLRRETDRREREQEQRQKHAHMPQEAQGDLHKSRENLRKQVDINLRMIKDLEANDAQLKAEILERRQTESALRKNRDELESLLKERTADLLKSNRTLTRSEARFRKLLEFATDAVVLANRDDRIVLVNRQAEKMFGYEPHEVIGRKIETLIPTRLQDQYLRDRQEYLKDPTPHPPGQGLHLLAMHKDGTEFPVDIGLNPLDTEEGPVVLSTFRDLTHSAHSEQIVRESEQRFRGMADASHVMIWTSAPDKQWSYLNKTWLDFVGQTFDEAKGFGWLNAIHPDDRQRVLDHYLDAFNAHEPFQQEYRLRRADGQYRWIIDTGTPRLLPDGSFEGYIGSGLDTTDHKQLEDQLRVSALHDPLTGLPNRALFMDRLTQAARYAQRHPDFLFAVLYLDINRFKQVNDTLGHEAGDRLLQLIAKRLLACTRACDTVARLGGDEFIILMEGIHGPDDAAHTCDRVHSAFAGPIPIDGHNIGLSLTIGTTLSNIPYSQPQDLIHYADTAMCSAKADAIGGAEISPENKEQRNKEQKV